MSMAKDGRSGKSTPTDWRKIFQRILPPHVWRTFERRVPGCSDPRTAWQPKLLVLCWTFMGSLCAPGLGLRFDESWELLAALFPHRRRPGRTYPSLMKRSRRLGSDVMQTFLHGLHGHLQTQLADRWSGFGWTVFAVDGTRFEAPRTRRNQQQLKCAGKEKTGPQWALTALIHLPSRILWDWRQGPGTASERGHLRAMLADLPAPTLLLADAGFTGFDLLGAMQSQGLHFLVRCGANVRLLFRDEALLEIEPGRGGDARVLLWPQDRRHEPPLELRLIVVARRARRMYLLTNVLKRERLPRKQAAHLYGARWGIELKYRDLKQTLGRRKLLADSPEMSAWELAGSVLALALLLMHAAWLQDGQPERASVARLWHLLRRVLECLRYGASTRWAPAALRAAQRDGYQRRRPKHSRDYPRKKRESPPGAPKMRRMTLQEIAENQRLQRISRGQVG